MLTENQSSEMGLTLAVLGRGEAVRKGPNLNYCMSRRDKTLDPYKVGIEIPGEVHLFSRRAN